MEDGESVYGGRWSGGANLCMEDGGSDMHHCFGHSSLFLYQHLSSILACFPLSVVIMMNGDFDAVALDWTVAVVLDWILGRWVTRSGRREHERGEWEG